jgi:hypothetical protein
VVVFWGGGARGVRVGMGGGPSHALTHVLFALEVVAIVLMMWQAPTLANLPLSRHTAAFTFPADVAARSVIIYASFVLDSSGPQSTSSLLSPPSFLYTRNVSHLSLHIHMKLGVGVLL